METCSPSSTGAHRPNPLRPTLPLYGRRGGASNPDVLPDGETLKRIRFSIAETPEWGRQENASLRSSLTVRGGDGSKRVSGCVCKSRPRGSGPCPNIRAGSFNSAHVGSLRPGDRRSRLFDRSRGPGANLLAVNSSTTKGPEGLVSDSDWRRCRTVKNFSPMGKGELLRSAP